MPRSRPHDALDRYLARLQRRATVVYVLRAAVLAAGAGGLTFAAVAMGVGPVATTAGSVAAWGAVGLIALAAGWVALRPLASVRGTRAARLIERRDPWLGSSARSAVELAQDPTASETAPDLVVAHRNRVREALVQLPAARVVPWSSVRHPTLVLGALGAAVAAVLVAGVDRAASGAYAMFHPEVRSEEGLAVAAVVGNTEARLVFPAHLGRKPVELHDAHRIEAPRGTTVHYTIRPRVEAEEASLEVVGRDVRLVRSDPDRFRGRFVVREGGPLRIRVREPEGSWLEDPVRRTVHALEDKPPRVVLTSPEEDTTVDLEEAVPIVWDATDDVGLRRVQLVVRTPDGQEHRRNLLSVHDAPHRTRAEGNTEIAAAEYDTRPGDQLEVWVEGRDGNMVSGPNVGASGHRTLTIASEATRRLETLAEIEETLDIGLGALADRLEWEMPERRDDARKRFDAVQRSGRAFVDALHGVAERTAEDGTLAGPTDGSLYRTMAKRVDRKLTREARAHRRKVPALSHREQLDQHLVRELEKDILRIADLLGEARLEDAAALTRELEELRREMTSLVSELRRTDSPEARRALRAALARAQSRMRELMGRIAAMGKNVPSDFLNADAIRREREQENALEAMRQALERNDLEAMERQLMELEHQIGSMAEALGNAETSYAEARFGPRQKAMAEAMDALAGLEAEQRKLARRSDEVRRKAAEQALQASSALDEDQARELAREARRARKALDEVAPQSLGPLDDESVMRAQQRLQDTADALESGDLGEARKMAQEAVNDLQGLARDLELSALMFPGADGRTGEAARNARRASRRARDLRDGIEKSIPRMSDFLGKEARRRMRGDSSRQQDAAQAAGKLAERFDQGPDGQPLSPDAAESARKAERTMRQAAEQLDEEDPVEAARAQEEAARRLAKLREDLEESQRSRSGGSGGSRGGSNGRPEHHRRVRIPGADEADEPLAIRRKLLDAMREQAPPEYEGAVRKYYEELLR